MKVREVMTTEVLTVDEFTTVANAINIMEDNSLSSLIIEPLDKKDSYGIVTEIDILYKVVAKGYNPERLCVRDIMTKPCIEVNPDLNIKSAAQLFAKTGICHAPIVQKRLFSPKKLLGIISVRDLLRSSSSAKQLDKRESYHERVIQDSQPQKSPKSPKEELTDYQRLRAQGAISPYSTRILEKMPQDESEPLDSDRGKQPRKREDREDFPEKAIQDSQSKKSSKPRKEELTDYQRLRAQGAISPYSTRIFQKMSQEESERLDGDADFGEQPHKPHKKEDSPEEAIQDSQPKKSSKPRKEELTDYQRLRAQGAISPYSTRILDKMPKHKKDKDKQDN